MTLTKLTALHHTHLALGAVMTDEQGWQVPDRYPACQDELLVAQNGVGVCDISAMGKWDVQGNDLRDGQWSVVNGQCWRLAHDHLLFTTKPEDTEQVGARLMKQAAPIHRGVHVTDMTSTLATLYLVGPHSRNVLSKLTSLNLAEKVLPHLSCAQANVAKVRTLIVRYDVRGLLAYQLFCTRDYAEFVWEALMAAGIEFGIGPLGWQTWGALNGET